MLREIRVTRDSVIDQIGDITAVKTFVVTDAGKARGWIDSKRDAGEGNENKRDDETAAPAEE